MTDGKILDKTFEPEHIEHSWYEAWEKAGVFQPEVGEKGQKKGVPYVIVMPPPNVTGVLHNGHALFVTLQDILIRFHRMKGRNTLWVPGTDHAGISTQTVVERQLFKHEQKTRHDLGREAFLEHVWEWKEKHGNRIVEQLKLLGASADWTRMHFTMDEQCSLAVRVAFVRLWDEGLIYRKERLVNWDPKTQTALSNEEVDHIERAGELYSFAYRLKDDPTKEIVVATTRPETMLGDTAVAVHPKDDRYQALIGKKLLHPFVENREITVIADEFVDMEYGTGAVKITPAHDPNDFAMAQRHGLPFITIFNRQGFVNEHGGEFSGLERFSARKKVKERLEELGLFRNSQAIQHAVAISQRSGVDIEPMLSRQYFVNTKPLAAKAYKAVNEGEVQIIPAHFKKTWDHFLLNIQDWCISRQLWWGHRIPVFYDVVQMKEAVRNFAEQHRHQTESQEALENGASDHEILAIALEELDEDLIRSFSVASIEDPSDGRAYIQEEDVLDTWFSAGLWPFSVLGWPKETEDLAMFYPGTVLETGFDILFFWVARMMMFGIHFMGRPPFRDIYLHSMVRDSHGRKMSKSLGNAIDPIDVIKGISLEELIAKTKTYPVPAEHLPKVLAGIAQDFPEGIPASGADGLRLSLAIFSGQGRDVKLSIPRVAGYRAFLNKVWNASRFALMNVKVDTFSELKELHQKAGLENRFIISRLQKTIHKVDEAINHYKFSDAAESIYHFFWTELCDQYIESAKVALRNEQDPEGAKVTEQVLVLVLDHCLRLLHPFCPFISEEIWQALPNVHTLKKQGIHFCAKAPYPIFEPSLVDEDAERDMAFLGSIATMIRNARQESNLPANKPVPVKLFFAAKSEQEVAFTHIELLKHLARASTISCFERGTQAIGKNVVVNSSAQVDAVIELEGLIDASQELLRLEQELKKVVTQKQGLINRLESPGFLEKAPPPVVAQHREQLAELQKKESQILEAKLRLQKM